ncbi:maltose alpha-D-glucosyltransferase/alpha-amylase [Variovorax boronicumulans]|uniref:maltose alpha-D-glucosyltransferase n=1 Tax=Variovorax boronicumulans TaxID=436515 RepID=UPI00278647B2|nr:maltose alpha-D-glucosyltransferase [Variovorax boronicumulans]MDP9991283.1 maltose alpha-D-glucosyltransferase/alpha-amylase [Variovorax boronicumulans]MDQ0003353.1 maltose alpha-D-glucosyltransferase/alpha-amylase [Variovorax boronicumulans]MDQ0041382.1 maltose alpha-D-glucosyltransferase/alpha-amylase [Variovorax boronicumulans]
MNAPVSHIALETVEIDNSDDPLWYRDAVIYQLNVKAFFDSNNDGMGDFKGVTAKLDYVKELGVNTIWLMPFYPSPLRDDGYDISEYEDVHPQYGTLDDFREMLAEAHKRGLRVITELVINHTSSEHPWFKAARLAPPGSPERNFYVWSDTDQIYQGTRIIFTDTETSNWTWDPVAKQYFWHRFFSHQPDLNFDNPAVMEAILKTMKFWLDMGVDGFRLDAIPYLVERDGTSNENLPETHAVIKQLRAAIDAQYKNRFLLAEANMWPEDVREYFGDGDECHMAYHFPLMPRMYMAIAQEDRHPIVEIMAQTPDIPEGCQWAIFLRNHDELTLEMVTSKERDYMYTMYAADMRARINLGIRRRLAPLMENDLDRVKLMNGMLLSMPGSPIIYYGDEIGMGDNVFVGDRNGVRTPMQWSPDRNAGFSRADPQRLYLQPIMDPMFGYEALNVETQARDSSSLLNWTKRMLAVRKTSHAFGRGKRRFLKPGNRKILAYLSEYDGDVILTVFNLSRAAQPVELDLSEFKGFVPIEMLGRAPFPPIGELPYLLTLASYGFYWFKLTAEADAPSWHEQGVALQEWPTLVLFDGWTSFFRERVMPWRIGMSERMRTQFELETLPRHIEIQRWYASKGTAIRRARVVDHAVWEANGQSWLLPLLDLDGPPGGATYFMPLALAWEERDEERMAGVAQAAIARIRQQAQVGLMGDAFYDEAFCRELVRTIGNGAELPTANGKLVFKPTAAFAEMAVDIDALPVGRPSGVSSNTVVTLNETLFLKGYRHVREGINPELEMGRFLTEVARYPNCVPVLGALEYMTHDGRTMTLAMVQSYMANQGDGWDYTLGYLERFLRDVATTDGNAPEATEVADVHGGFLALMATLGRRTAELHRALATRTGAAAFDPEPLAPADHAGFKAHAAEDATATLALLRERIDLLPGAAQADARTLLEAADALQAGIASRRPVEGVGVKTRYHGDYHLGQVLVKDNDFVIIDFEGEPARTFDERRTKGSPLRDVAGMLRSFNYARWSALRRVAQSPEEAERLAAPAIAWEQATRAAFLAGYGDAVDTELLALFELDKALYELRYELNNRTDWAQVPLHGVLALIRPARG